MNETLPITIIDSHAHIDMKNFNDDRQDLLARARSMGLGIVTIGIDVNSSKAAFELAKKHSNVQSSAGIHPHDATTFNENSLNELRTLWQSYEVVAVGEIGLDFYRNYSPHDQQRQAFEGQLEEAAQCEKPVIIHSRNSLEEAYSILANFPKVHGVIHCFPGNEHDAEKFIELGYYISIPGTVTYKKAGKTKRVAREIPLERLLIETDCPFLTPVPHRGKRNEPAYVQYVAEEIANLRNIAVDEVLEHTKRNTCLLFNLPWK